MGHDFDNKLASPVTSVCSSKAGDRHRTACETNI